MADLRTLLDQAVLEVIEARGGAATTEDLQACNPVRKAIEDGALSQDLVELKTGDAPSQLGFRWADAEQLFVRKGDKGEYALKGARLRSRVQQLERRLNRLPRCLLALRREAASSDGTEDAPQSRPSSSSRPSRLPVRADETEARNTAQASPGVAIVAVPVAHLPSVLAALQALQKEIDITLLEKEGVGRIRINASLPVRVEALHAIEHCIEPELPDSGSALELLDTEMSQELSAHLAKLNKARKSLDAHLNTATMAVDPVRPTNVVAEVPVAISPAANKIFKLPLLLGEFAVKAIKNFAAFEGNREVAQQLQVTLQESKSSWFGVVRVDPLAGWFIGTGSVILPAASNQSECSPRRIRLLQDKERSCAVAFVEGDFEKVQSDVQFIRVSLLERFAHNPDYPARQFAHRRSRKLQKQKHLPSKDEVKLLLDAVMLETNTGLVCRAGSLYVGAHTFDDLGAVLIHPKIKKLLATGDWR